MKNLNPYSGVFEPDKLTEINKEFHFKFPETNIILLLKDDSRMTSVWESRDWEIFYINENKIIFQIMIRKWESQDVFKPMRIEYHIPTDSIYKIQFRKGGITVRFDTITITDEEPWLEILKFCRKLLQSIDIPWSKRSMKDGMTSPFIELLPFYRFIHQKWDRSDFYFLQEDSHVIYKGMFRNPGIRYLDETSVVFSVVYWLGIGTDASHFDPTVMMLGYIEYLFDKECFNRVDLENTGTIKKIAPIVISDESLQQTKIFINDITLFAKQNYKHIRS